MCYINYYDEKGEEQWMSEHEYHDSLTFEKFAESCIHESTHHANEKLICSHCGEVLRNLY